ncbi:unnamed protein product [Phytomonas sp. Hart1]|nr:unnamed protein product [Phytomonas sp. Hart1]|eukprot:CCW66324.1 unnamed protein product [Phytomonas sp. isolate Hart1]
MNNPLTGVPPGSAMRTGSTRGAVVGVGGSIRQSISVSAQPAVIREGVRAASRRGLGTSAGPARQVGDRSYYIGLLRPKIAELSAEIERLNEEERMIAKNGAVLVQLEQKARALKEEVGGLKGQLADVNLAIESSDTRDLASMQKENAQLAQENTRRRKEVDKLFLNLREAEGRIKENMKALDEEMQGLDRRLLSDNQDHDTYKAIREEAFAVSQKVLERQHEVRTLTAKQELLMTKLEKDGSRRRAAELLREILRKRRERDELAKECALSVEEEKQLLMKKVLATRSDIEALKRQIADTCDALDESKTLLSTLDDEVQNYTSENVKAYQALKEKEQEMQVFLDDYPDKEREALGKLEREQQEITTLLERISRALELQRQLPTGGNPGSLQVLTTEVDAKQEQIKNDQRTHQRLEKELMERKTELEKVSHLDNKIKEELESQNAKMTEQRAEIERYEDLDGLRQEVDALRNDLEEQLTYFKCIRDKGTKLVNAAMNDYNAEKKKLNTDSFNQSLTTQEQKLRMLWQSAFTLEDFVRLKEKEVQYLPIKAECLRIVDELNIQLKDPARLAGSAGPPTISLGN